MCGKGTDFKGNGGRIGNEEKVLRTRKNCSGYSRARLTAQGSESEYSGWKGNMGKDEASCQLTAQNSKAPVGNHGRGTLQYYPFSFYALPYRSISISEVCVLRKTL